MDALKEKISYVCHTLFTCSCSIDCIEMCGLDSIVLLLFVFYSCRFIHFVCVFRVLVACIEHPFMCSIHSHFWCPFISSFIALSAFLYCWLSMQWKSNTEISFTLSTHLHYRSIYTGSVHFSLVSNPPFYTVFTHTWNGTIIVNYKYKIGMAHYISNCKCIS